MPALTTLPSAPCSDLYDWKFEVMGMLFHARDLEQRFGIGPHTLSVPRIEPAVNTSFEWLSHRVSDEEFKRLIAVLRLSIPYAGLIVTCREKPELLREVMPMCTQRDASSRIGIGAYSDAGRRRSRRSKQQFMLGDTRSLDEVIRELASAGYITSFCTAGYRCGRTGKNIMTLLRTGKEGCFCKLNAVLTFQEWLEDFGSADTRRIGEGIIEKEMAEIRARTPGDFTPGPRADARGIPLAHQGRRAGPLLLRGPRWRPGGGRWSIGRKRISWASCRSPRAPTGASHTQRALENFPLCGYRVHPGLLQGIRPGEEGLLPGKRGAGAPGSTQGGRHIPGLRRGCTGPAGGPVPRGRAAGRGRAPRRT